MEPKDEEEKTTTDLSFEKEITESDAIENKNTLEDSAVDCDEKDIFESKEKDIFESKEKDTFENKEKDAFESKEKDTFDSKEKDIFDSKEKDTFESKEKDTFESKEKDTFESKEKDTFESKEKDTVESKEKDTFESKEKDTFESKEKNTSANTELKDEEKPLSSYSEKTQMNVPYLNGTDELSSSKSGSDSEKENRVDATDSSNVIRKAKSDIITLSDESDEDSGKLIEDSIFDEITPEEIKLRRKIVKRLQGELRNEEAKLVLLKKLRQSQLSHQIQDGATERPDSNNVRHPGAPPPLVHGQQGNNTPILKLPQSSHNGHHSQTLPHQSHNSQVQSRQSAHGPPPLVNMGPRMSNHHSHSQQHGISRSLMQGHGHRGNMPHMMPGFRQNQTQSSSSPHVAQRQEEQQTPAQRQAAAKLALRKQLEKTLLQIPPPKPPPPEMNFIPSLASPDFILLLGLEEVVNFIIDSQLIAKGQKNPDEKFVCNPFSCIQCGADFTPVWKREKPGSKNVICEHCVTSNQKKALKQEHTNRLKSAFVKALQQEQEIERMQAQSLSQPPSSQPSQPPSHPTIATTTATAPSSASPMGISSSSVMNLTSYKPSLEQLRQHQNFIQAHQAQLRAGSSLGLPFVQRGPFPYQLPFTKPSDIQRQYFLDLLPRSGNMSWKS